MSWFYRISAPTVKLLLWLLTRWQIRGKENVPPEGPVLVVANHLNLADPPLLGVSLGRYVMFMAKEELFRSKFTGYFIRSFGAFPVHRGQLDRKAMYQAKQVLADGQPLAMFPEGSRSKNSRLQAGYSGSALIAVRSGVPILPVGIVGTEKIKGPFWWLRRPRLTVIIGRPFQLPPVNGRLTREELAQSTSYMMERIADLLPAEYRGDYIRPGNQNGIED